MTDPFFFDPEALAALADRERETFHRAVPYPHVVIDGLFPDSLLDDVVAEAPSADASEHSVAWDDANSLKKGLREDWRMGTTTRLLMGQFNSAPFVDFLESLTGITGLVPDPHFFGGGVHTIESGGYLRIHADFNHYPRLDLERRINALLYLNRDWQDEWGGHLELWDRSLSNCVARIAPVFNRLVIFATTDTAYHGHPNPLETPPGIARRSLALYYYSVDRPSEEQTGAHSTLWQAGVGERVPRPDEGFESTAPEPAPAGRVARWTAQDWVPPVLWRVAHRVKEAPGRRRPGPAQ
jgi:2OG-Fe(II) oxygenase superfamily